MAFFIGGTAGAIIGGAAISTVGGALLADDNGAEAANGAATDATRLQAEIAKDQWERYKQIYEPMERDYVKDAQNFDSPEQYAKAAGQASATVASQFGKAKDRLGRTPGLDPSSGAYQAGLTGLELSQAATDATQQNAARTGVQDKAYARKTDALSLGKGLPANATSGLGAAAQNSLSLANASQAQANNQAAGFGQLVNRVVSTPTVSNWLGNVGGGATSTNSDMYSLTQGGNGGIGLKPPTGWN